MDLLHRRDISELKDTPIADFTPTDLAALLIQKYPYDPVSHLEILRVNKDIGGILYSGTRCILEGAGYDTRAKDITGVSVKDNTGRSGYKIRTSNK